MSDFWEDQKKQADFAMWLDNLRGSVLCDCDHGCRGWIADNGAKALKIIELLNKDSKDKISALNEIVQKHTSDVAVEVWNENTRLGDE